ncbi:Inner membrane protein RclC [BD1-7 clade bacterium]|uniref:Inner membrane protein RclC n=1 Tax=BD1-7 clade bacterium TaxID=2029982 RepID=A0A5S9PIB7_9GAMM|nr:Inner membrane protein RclC [BD1-7 clade bacterium]
MNNLLNLLRTWKPREDAMVNYFSLISALYLIWLGLLKLTTSEIAQTQMWVGQSPLFVGFYHSLGTAATAWLMLVIEVAAGVLILAGCRSRKAGLLGAVVAMLIFAANFTYLFTNPVWVDDLGGFPFLGSGQNIVKYLSMFAVVAYIAAHHYQRLNGLESLEPQKRVITGLAWGGIIIVMGWIGFLKFFTYEAEGIVRLMQSNFLFSWTYHVWSVQGASNFIGTIEWIFLLLLLQMPWNKTLGRLGVLGIAATAVGTLTFMFSVPGWDANTSFPLLNRTGVFVLKDQFLLACAVLIAYRHA